MVSPAMESFSYPRKNGEYTFRVPTPPRIVVPPPNLDHDALPQITLSADRSQSYLEAIKYDRIITKNALTDWNYEKRREAQRVLPFLFLGPMGVVKDEPFLAGTKHNTEDRPEPITMLLNIRQKHGLNGLMAASLKRATDRGVELRTIEVANNQELISVFPHTTKLINEHLANTHSQTGRLGRVLVFCESGNERSAAIVAAYLMKTHIDVDYIKAMQLIQAQRFCANFDDNLKRLLQGYWDIICAERSVASNPSLSATTAKRGLRDEDGDEDMDDAAENDDLARFGGRAFAPFVDQP